MRNKDFYLYQCADMLFTFSCRAFGMLFAWKMIEHYHLAVELGWFISLAWLLQVLILLGMGFVLERVRKKTIPLLCVVIGFICMMTLHLFMENSPLGLGGIYLIMSLLSIAIQPIGAIVIPNIYQDKNLERAFQLRGFVNALNTVVGVAIAGLLISRFSEESIVVGLLFTIAISGMLFFIIKIKEIEATVKNPTKFIAIKALINNKIERLMVVVSALSNFILTPVLVYITPILVVEKYGKTVFEIGLSEAIFGLGMIVGSLYFGKKLNQLLGIRFSTVLSIFMVAVGLFVLLIIPFLYGLYLGLFLAGLGVVTYNINTTQIRCQATPELFRGAFESTFLAVCIAPIPLGVAFTTMMLDSGDLILALGLFLVVIIISAFAVVFSKDFHFITKVDAEELDGYYEALYPRSYSIA